VDGRTVVVLPERAAATTGEGHQPEAAAELRVAVQAVDDAGDVAGSTVDVEAAAAESIAAVEILRGTRFHVILVVENISESPIVGSNLNFAFAHTVFRPGPGAIAVRVETLGFVVYLAHCWESFDCTAAARVQGHGEGSEALAVSEAQCEGYVAVVGLSYGLDAHRMTGLVFREELTGAVVAVA